MNRLLKRHIQLLLFILMTGSSVCVNAQWWGGVSNSQELNGSHIGSNVYPKTCEIMVLQRGTFFWANSDPQIITLPEIPTDFFNIEEVFVYGDDIEHYAAGEPWDITSLFNIQITPVNATTSQIVVTKNPGADVVGNTKDGFSVIVYVKGTMIKAGNMPLGIKRFSYEDEGGADNTFMGPVTVTQPILGGGTCVTAANDSYTVPVGGGTTASVLANDNYRGGGAGSTTPSNVTVTGVTVPAGFTVNANGTITVGAGVTAGSYTLTYQICDSQVATGDQVCSTATVTITVNAPCTNSGNSSVNLNSMYTGTLPSNVVLEWWTSADRQSPGVKVTDPTHVTTSGRYYVFFYDTVNLCYNTNLSTSYVDVSILPPCACFNNPATGGSNHDTKMGITLLKRAGAENADNWPMVRKSGHIALESNTQGFVVTRMTTAQLTAIKDANNAVEGMMSYDTDAKCLKIYDGTDWKCFSTPSCP